MSKQHRIYCIKCSHLQEQFDYPARIALEHIMMLLKEWESPFHKTSFNGLTNTKYQLVTDWNMVSVFEISGYPGRMAFRSWFNDGFYSACRRAAEAFADRRSKQ